MSDILENKIPLHTVVENATKLLSNYIDINEINIFENIDTSLHVLADEDTLSETIYFLLKKIIMSYEKNNHKKMNIYVNIFKRNNTTYLTIEDNTKSDKNLDIKINNSTLESFCVSNDNEAVRYKLSFF